MSFTISDLRERPEFFDTIVDRVWEAWWKPHGTPRADFERRARENFGPHRVPTAFVAHDGDRFLGTALLIASDLDERPELTPWVAAVWVEPDARQRGVGRTLVARARNETFRLYLDTVYLCARPAMRSFYLELGWAVLDESVGQQKMDLFSARRIASQFR